MREKQRRRSSRLPYARPFISLSPWRLFRPSGATTVPLCPQRRLENGAMHVTVEGGPTSAAIILKFGHGTPVAKPSTSPHPSTGHKCRTIRAAWIDFAFSRDVWANRLTRFRELTSPMCCLMNHVCNGAFASSVSDGGIKRMNQIWIFHFAADSLLFLFCSYIYELCLEQKICIIIFYLTVIQSRILQY